MLGRTIEIKESAAVGQHQLVIGGSEAGCRPIESCLEKLGGDSFLISRRGGEVILQGASDRALIHAVYRLLETAGSSFEPWREPLHPRIDEAALADLADEVCSPAFARRAMASDLMTWHYEAPERLAAHLAHDRHFTAWMSARGLNAFLFIRHARDSRMRIDELGEMMAAGEIEAEYGGHVLELLMPRSLYGSHPEFFPADEAGRRHPRGNLCVSNAAAIAQVRDAASGWLRDYPESRMLHVWGADLWGGGWCRCSGCSNLSPQLQYMAAVSAVAAAAEPHGLPIAYLAYHDTLEPDPQLRPPENVWFEWAPRERCYSHAIDDSSCARNRRYFESLLRYLDLFDGRGMVFEYYADAILFGGLGFASSSVIIRDLRAYHRAGVRSVSCLTFGAFSVFAYPLNLEVFARATRTLDFDSRLAIEQAASNRHHCPDMAEAYRTVELASRRVLSYGDVMRPYGDLAAQLRPDDLREGALLMERAADAAASIASRTGVPATAAERDLWRLSADILAALSDYVAARTQPDRPDRQAGMAAIDRIEKARKRLLAVNADFKGTWGSYDIERFNTIWCEGLRRRLDPVKSAEVSDEPPA
jgi:hypothetical protein